MILTNIKKTTGMSNQSRTVTGLLGKTCYYFFACLAFTEAAYRCHYAKVPSAVATVWKEEGEDVRISCPGFITDNSNLNGVEYTWYELEYDCTGMNQSAVIASHTGSLAGVSQDIFKQPDRMTIDRLCGILTIKNLTLNDEKTFTCVFMHTREHIATVHLKIRDEEFHHMLPVGPAQEDRYEECSLPTPQQTGVNPLKSLEVPNIHPSGKRIISIAGYTILGCAVFTVAVSFLCWAICSATEKRKHQISLARPQTSQTQHQTSQAQYQISQTQYQTSQARPQISLVEHQTSQAQPQISQVQHQTSQIEEEHYEELPQCDRCIEEQDDLHCYTPVRPSACVIHYDESDIPGPLPSPPPLPDVRDLNGRRPLDIFPEREQHYNSRTTIMATIPRKDSVNVPKTESLEDIIEYCKGSYHVKCDGSSLEDASTISGDVPARLDSSDGEDDVRKNSPVQNERVSELYMDMSGITAEQKDSID